MAAAILALPRAAIGRVVDYALPPRCPGCGIIVAADHSFCLTCWGRLDFLGGPACAACSQPLESAHEETHCGACLADPPPFDRLRAGVAYGDIARTLALKLKHGGRLGIAETMARVMRRTVAPIAPEVLVVPVPLHRRRIWRRGYNQAALIARALAAQAGGTLALDLVERRKATPLLRELGRAARKRAVAGAFALSPAQAKRVRGASILLVDDVYTTGATARAIARTLRRAGAARIEIACWARVMIDEGEASALPER